ncbi:hypothetical protein [Pontibacillus yanchengensis]|uniref:Lipoprotein n=1 Tax=Pontibacillus yanchengensis Y32 TaxID=1385514 RepID=A0A0A2TAA6_9BACI|nr:hypothetical protein [Pontibacillus yanchengensis]KGP72757.1 hypothetical protein N782_10875 [Pontibacillus yanchengensis Y32]
MKWKLILGLIGIICLLCACSNEEQAIQHNQDKNEENHQENDSNKENQGPEKGEQSQVTLTFQPAEVKKLKSTQPKDDWEKIGKKLVNITKDKEGSLSFYSPVSKEETDSEKNEVHAIITVEETQYDIGIVGQYGMDAIDIQQVDVTNDKQTELLITGDMGPTSNEMNVIGYQNESLVKLLTAGNGDLVNIDNDDAKELISHSKKASPPYVWVYRWKNDHFEKGDVAKATPGKAVLIVKRDNQKVLKVIMEKQDPKYFQYSKGRLKPVTIDG